MPEATTKEQELIDALAANQGLLGEIKAQKAELNKIAGSVVDTLIKAGELDADKREKAIENLVTQPVKVAMCLKTTAEALIEKQQQKQAAPAAMGSGAEINKTAGVKTANQRSAADQAFLTRLGLA
jgi:DNA-directed RNA polymerase subunit F